LTNFLPFDITVIITKTDSSKTTIKIQNKITRRPFYEQNHQTCNSVIACTNNVGGVGCSNPFNAFAKDFTTYQSFENAPILATTTAFTTPSAIIPPVYNNTEVEPFVYDDIPPVLHSVEVSPCPGS